MKEGPDIARLGALIGDPARANILMALMGGKALTPSELAIIAGVTPPTVSAHLAKLESGGLVVQRKQGRHRYYAIADDAVGALLERMMGVAAGKGHVRVRTGPKDPALRKARVCYNHLAGELAVRMFDSFRTKGFVTENGDTLTLTDEGRSFAKDLGIDTTAMAGGRRPVCRACLDWSARRSHLAGTLGTALLQRFYDLKWARRVEGSRVIGFTRQGERAFLALFPGSGPDV